MIWLWVALNGASANEVADGARILEGGDVDGAIAALEVGLQQPNPGVAVYYNLGCAYYRKGEPVKALGWWRAARQMAPWDSDLTHNVALARTELPPGQGRPRAVGERRAWRELVTPGPVAAVGAAAAAAGTAGLLVSRWRGLSRWPALVVWLLGLFLLGLAADGLRQERPIGVVVTEVARLRDAPDAGGLELGLIPVGTEVRIDDARGPWAQVVAGDGRSGWVPREVLLVPGLPAAPPEPPPALPAEDGTGGQPAPAPLLPEPSE